MFVAGSYVYVHACLSVSVHVFNKCAGMFIYMCAYFSACSYLLCICFCICVFTCLYMSVTVCGIHIDTKTDVCMNEMP